MANGPGWKTKIGGCVALVVLALSFVAPATAEQTIEESMDRFDLFANCEPMFLLVESPNSRSQEIGLTKESVQASVESRLRSARLYSEARPTQTYLYVNVLVVGTAFSMRLEFNKKVFDSFSDEIMHAPTWSYGGAGTHGGSASYVLNLLSQYMDHFLVEFLRVNEEACAKR